MANDNNNIKELVAEDDDPTVELALATELSDEPGDLEIDAKTFDQVDRSDRRSGESDDELRAEIRSRDRAIGRLQYENEQLRTRYLGLDSENNARESQTENLLSELATAAETNERKANLIKTRDKKIKNLKFEIRQREKEHRLLQARCDNLQKNVDDATRDSIDSSILLSYVQDDRSLQQRLHQSETYADDIRQQAQDLIAANAVAERQNAGLSQRVEDLSFELEAKAHALAEASSHIEKLETQLDGIQDRHEEEIRILRFELGQAQDTVVESEQLNSQLTSELIDARSFKDELERAVEAAKKQSRAKIKELQKKIKKLTRIAEDHEQKLSTKSEAITVLLAELARKSEKIELSTEINHAIPEDEPAVADELVEQDLAPSSSDRVSRVLMGTVGDQVVRFPLFKDRLTIGRTQDNDIQLKAAYISRRHAVIHTDGTTTRIIDWGSKNGIQVNSERVTEHFLSHGDILMIGNARFRYEERRKREN